VRPGALLRGKRRPRAAPTGSAGLPEPRTGEPQVEPPAVPRGEQPEREKPERVHSEPEPREPQQPELVMRSPSEVEAAQSSVQRLPASGEARRQPAGAASPLRRGQTAAVGAEAAQPATAREPSPALLGARPRQLPRAERLTARNRRRHPRTA